MEATKDFSKPSIKSISITYKNKEFVNSKKNKIGFIQKPNNKKSYSHIRQNLLELTKNEIKQSNELIIKSYKEDLEVEKLVTNDSLNVVRTNNENNIYHTPDLNSEEELELEYIKNKFAAKDCSSSNLSD